METNIPAGFVLETDPDRVWQRQTRDMENLKNMTDEELSGDKVPELEDLHKMHFDGTHYVTSKEGENKGVERKKKERTYWDEVFDCVYALGKSEGVKPSTMADYIYRQMRDVYCYPMEDAKVKPLREFVRNKLFNISQAKIGRARRFKYKSGFVRWNYFITITYSDKLIGEYAFYKSLKKQFGNLHTRHGWKVAGAFERGKKTNRLHFHALAYVPDGELMGELRETKTFDFDEHRMKVIHQNLYFSVRYGRNDFEAIDSNNRALINKKMGYIQKYIQKSGERMFYSRGLPCHVMMKIKQSDVVAMPRRMFGIIMNYIPFDGVVRFDGVQSEEERRDPA